MSAPKPMLSSLLLAAPLYLSLSACSSGPGEEEFAPVINEIYTTVSHRHPSFYAKWPTDPQATLDFTVSINLSDPQGIGDLLQLYVTDLNNSKTYALFDADETNPYSRCYKGSGVFECRFVSTPPYNTLNLKNYEVFAKDSSGYVRRKAFDLLLESGAQPGQNNFAYSETYTGSTANGYRALEAMTVADNNLLFKRDGESFQIEFKVTDQRAKDYSLNFYDDQTPAQLIGSVSLDASAIQSHPIATGETTLLDLHWSSIRFEDEVSAEDIKVLHITLYDNPVPLIISENDLGDWYHLAATSQAIPLTE